MALTTQTVNDTLYYPDGTPMAGAFITFTLVGTGTSPEDSGTIPPSISTETTDGVGFFSVALWPNTLGYAGTSYKVEVSYTDPTTGKYTPKKVGTIQVPDTVGPHNLSELLELGSISGGAFYLGLITQAQYDEIIAGVASAEANATSAGVSADLALGYKNDVASAIVYQDLASIAASKTVTAVDVFVYDTSKDSDGGAWRKRTQGASWYNETLNTATRGSRREFPAVAVIVAEATKVTIYDGDDPSLPMWMVFEDGSGALPSIWRGGRTATSVSILNGVLCIGIDGSDGGYTGVYVAEFLADSVYRHNPNGIYGAGLSVFDRNDNSIQVSVISSASIVNGQVNDVAMTVLPDALVDPATGLQVPTIAVATDGGVSIIKDDGTVVDITTGACQKVAFAGDGLWVRNGEYVYRGGHPAVDTTIGGWRDWYAYRTAAGALTLPNGNVSSLIDGVVGTTDGLAFIAENPSAPDNGMVTHTTSTYNTGWMNGDIKGAFLSDTDDTDLVGSGELVTNGTFDTDISGWTLSANESPTWASGGYLQFNSTGAFFSTASQSITTVAGKSYTVSFDMVANPASLAFSVGTTNGGTDLLSTSVSTTGTHAFTFVATTTTSYISFSDGGGAGNQQIDNVSVRLAEEDRSVNGNGLQVFGTVTKNPVATGADLVAYSGFSPSNYLEQPYNSDLDFGTGDFCVMGWFYKGSSNSRYLLDRQKADDSDNTGRFYILSAINNTVSAAANDVSGTGAISITSGNAISPTSWVHFAFLRTGSVGQLYLNGVLAGTDTSAAGDITSAAADATLRVGVRHDLGTRWDGSAALLRISATAPTAEQIAKIYNDEKFLFQAGAQATLYGSSDAVTALAFDDSTQMLHVGTSAGRSVFQGLRRVENTTTAVGTAISASNSLVVEE